MSILAEFGDRLASRFSALVPAWRLLRNLDSEFMSGLASLDLLDGEREQFLEFTVPRDCYLLLHGIDIDAAFSPKKALRLDIYAGKDALLPSRQGFAGPSGFLGYHLYPGGTRKQTIPFHRVLAPETRIRIFATRGDPWQMAGTPGHPEEPQALHDDRGHDSDVFGAFQNPLLLIDWSPDIPVSTLWSGPTEISAVAKATGRITVWCDLTLSAPNADVNTWVEIRDAASPSRLVMPERPVATNVSNAHSRERTLAVTPGVEFGRYTVRLLRTGGPAVNLEKLRFFILNEEAVRDWENKVVINASVRGTRIPRDIYRTFGEL
ncbi:MAG: hypothetical protein KIT79_16040 [Deltaproteobacteria bacterium]|nr:hypothetical protein [Deltaproteobacteria bacterium]